MYYTYVIEIPERFMWTYQLLDTDSDRHVEYEVTYEWLYGASGTELRTMHDAIAQSLCHAWYKKYGVMMYTETPIPGVKRSFQEAKDTIIDGEWYETPRKEIGSGR